MNEEDRKIKLAELIVNTSTIFISIAVLIFTVSLSLTFSATVNFSGFFIYLLRIGFGAFLLSLFLGLMYIRKLNKLVYILMYISWYIGLLFLMGFGISSMLSTL